MSIWMHEIIRCPNQNDNRIGDSASDVNLLPRLTRTKPTQRKRKQN